jgi:hypothetical protein
MKWSAYNSGTVNTTKKIAKMVAADDAKERKQEPEVPCEGWEPPKREWVGFTHEELAWLNEALNLGGRLAVIEAIEKALKEKNT